MSQATCLGQDSAGCMAHALGATTEHTIMTRPGKLLQRILQGTSDANIPFDGLCRLLDGLGFVERIRGDHHIFTREGVEEILNLQPKGNSAKAYQVRQVRDVILRYSLGDQEDAEI